MKKIPAPGKKSQLTVNLTPDSRITDTSYADVRAYCSHVIMYCKRTRLLSSHPRLFIHLSYYQKSRLTAITKITCHEE